MISKLIEKDVSSGGCNEYTYKLLMDDETGEFFVEHSWDNLDTRGNISDGTETTPLKEFEKKQSRIYEKALGMSKKEPFTRAK